MAERFIEEGMEKGVKKSIKGVLFNRFNIMNLEVNKSLDEIDDLSVLESLFNKAFQVQSLDDFKVILDNIVK